MVDSQELLNGDYNEEIEVHSDEEMFPMPGNSFDLLQQMEQTQYELKDWDSQTIELFNSQTYADDASKVLINNDFAVAMEEIELPVSLKNLEPGEPISVEIFTAHINPNAPTSSTLDHLKAFPSLESFQNPAYNFTVSLPSEASEKSSWMYSDPLSKLFVKMGNTCTFNAYFNAATEQSTVIRAMVVCSAPEDLHIPVSRCDNHRCSDNSTISDEIKTHVVRCKNEQVNYVGKKDGNLFQDRLAVLVPMGYTNKAGITLEFVCQNSCRNINRRATALVFTLEDENKRILGRQLFQIKICTNIKRDKLNEERAALEEQVRKRKASQPLEIKRSKKLMKYQSSGQQPQQQHRPSSTYHTPIQIKEEAAGSKRCDIDPVTIQVTLPNRRMAKRMLENGIGLVSSAIVRSHHDAERTAELMQYIHDIRRTKSSLGGLPNSQSSVDSD